jgi:putative ABC transport system permease protein
MTTHYLKLSLKVLGRRKFFTFISLFGISFTLVTLMLVTALLDHALAPHPPETRQDRTVGIYYAEMRGERWRRNGFAGYGLLDRHARDLPNVEMLAISSTPEAAYSYVNGARVKSFRKRTDANFWRVLDFRFLEGGPFTDDDVASGRFVAVINDATRQRFFGGGTALGRTLDIDGQRFTVVGVVPDIPILRIVPFADVWVPHTTAKSDSYTRELVGNYMGILLLEDPAKLALTRDELWSRLRTAQLDNTAFQTIHATPETVLDTLGRMFLGGGRAAGTSGYGARLQLALAVGAGLFMLLPAVNLVNLNTSRIMERRSEIGVRKAFGASSRTLVGQFLVENVILTMVGALVGFVLAAWLLHLLNASGWIPYATLSLNYRIFGWGVLLALVFGVLSGVLPAWRMSRLHPVDALKGASR